MPEELVRQEKLAYILGAIYGDGCFTKDRKVSFSSTDEEFILKVVEFIQQLFNIKMSIRKTELSKKNPNWRDSLRFSSRRLYKLIRHFNPSSNVVPDIVLKGNKKIKSSFIGGFFDAEGNVDVRKVKRKDGRTDTMRHVKCFSNNTKLLEQIKNFLEELDIKSSIFRGKKNNFYVCIWNYRSLCQFNKLIGFVIKRKQILLEKAIESYKEIQTRWKPKDYKKVIDLRNITGFGAYRIKQELLNEGIKIPQPTIESWIYGKTKITENSKEV